MNRSWLFVLGVSLGLATAGCGPAVSDRELGEVIFEVPQVPGSEAAYVLPPVKPTAEQAAELERLSQLFDGFADEEEAEIAVDEEEEP